MPKKTPKRTKNAATARWRREWLEFIGGDIFFTQDRVAACAGEAIPEKTLHRCLEDAWIEWLKSETRMSVARYREIQDEDYCGFSSLNYVIQHPDHIYSGTVQGHAKAFSKEQNEIFLKAFREVDWTLADWKSQDCVEESWPGVRDQLGYFQPETAKAMIDHFVSLGLEEHEGIRTWGKYEENWNRNAALSAAPS